MEPDEAHREEPARGDEQGPFEARNRRAPAGAAGRDGWRFRGLRRGGGGRPRRCRARRSRILPSRRRFRICCRASPFSSAVHPVASRLPGADETVTRKIGIGDAVRDSPATRGGGAGRGGPDQRGGHAGPARQGRAAPVGALDFRPARGAQCCHSHVTWSRKCRFDPFVPSSPTSRRPSRRNR